MDDDLMDGFLIPNRSSGGNQGRRLRDRWLADGRVVEFEPVRDTHGIHHRLMLDGQKAPDGRYTLKDDITRFEVLDGVIAHEYYIERFRQDDATILVDCSRINGFILGCKAYTDEGPLPDGVYRLKFLNWIQVRDGAISQMSIFRMKDRD